jgi:hypothetical protein
MLRVQVDHGPKRSDQVFVMPENIEAVEKEDEEETFEKSKLIPEAFMTVLKENGYFEKAEEAKRATQLPYISSHDELQLLIDSNMTAEQRSEKPEEEEDDQSEKKTLKQTGGKKKKKGQDSDDEEEDVEVPKKKNKKKKRQDEAQNEEESEDEGQKEAVKGQDDDDDDDDED